MKTLTSILLVCGTLLAPFVAHAGDGDSDRKHPLTFVKDSAITTKVKALLADEKMSTLMHIKVDTDRHGIVVLSGSVRSPEQKAKAGAIARGTEGVTEVRNNLRITLDD
ncbi:MAG: BON domain-containing protein [Pseudomonadota bacterium]